MTARLDLSLNDNDDFLTPAVLELLQLAQTGCLRTMSCLRDDGVRIEFRLEKPHDLAVPHASLQHRRPSLFTFDDAFPLTRMAAGLARRRLIEVMWHGDGLPLWQETALGWAAPTRQGQQVIVRAWASFDPGAGWTQSKVAYVKADWLVPGNVVHQSPGAEDRAASRFQIRATAVRDKLIQLTTHTGAVEYLFATDQVPVEVGSLLSGQRCLAEPVVLQS